MKIFAALLTLRRSGPTISEISPQGTRERIYGGQVIAQALAAAYQTIEAPDLPLAARLFHPAGRPERRRSSSGRTRPRRRQLRHPPGRRDPARRADLQLGRLVPAAGGGLRPPVFAAPEAPRRRALAADAEARITTLPEEMVRIIRSRPMEMRPVEALTRQAPPRLCAQSIWMRMKDDMGGRHALNQAALAFVSDPGILEASLRPTV